MPSSVNLQEEKNMLFRGHNSVLHEPNNGRFVGLVVSQFGPVMSETSQTSRGRKEAADHHIEKSYKLRYQHSVAYHCLTYQVQADVLLKHMERSGLDISKGTGGGIW